MEGITGFIRLFRRTDGTIISVIVTLTVVQTRLQDLNVNLSFDAGKDAFYGNLRTLSTNRDEAFELLRLALNEPRFDDEPVKRIRGQILSGLKRSETSPQEIASKAWAAALFGDHPYGRPTDGAVKTVEGIGADDLKAFHKRIIARDNLYIAVVGAIDAESLETMLDMVFGSLPEKAQLKVIPDILPSQGVSDHIVLSVPQTIVRLGGRGLKRDDPDFIAAYIANHILGGGSFSSRLYAEIREKRGLAYSVGTGLAAYDHAGAYIGAVSTRADQAQTAIDIMTSQIKDFAESGPTQAEIKKAKSYLIGNYALRFDASRKIARQLIGIQLDNLGIDYIDRRNDLIRAVTKADVLRAAKRVFGGPVSIITVGPSES